MDASCQTLLEQLLADVTEDNRHGEWDTEAAVGGGEWDTEAAVGGGEWDTEAAVGGGEWDTEAAVGGEVWESVASGSDLEYTSASLAA